jgi:hypothetical protein
MKLLVLSGFGAGIAGVPLLGSTRVGRPASPTSVAGTRRRSRRRTRRRVHRNMRLNSLPYGCNTTRVRAGVSYYYCGGIWYRPSYSGTTVVYVVEEIEPGANTEVEFEEDV